MHDVIHVDRTPRALPDMGRAFTIDFDEPTAKSCKARTTGIGGV